MESAPWLEHKINIGAALILLRSEQLLNIFDLISYKTIMTIFSNKPTIIASYKIKSQCILLFLYVIEGKGGILRV